MASADALSAHKKERMLRTGKVQSMARIYGETYHSADVRAELGEAMLMGRAPEAAWEGMFWLYDGPHGTAP